MYEATFHYNRINLIASPHVFRLFSVGINSGDKYDTLYRFCFSGTGNFMLPDTIYYNDKNGTELCLQDSTKIYFPDEMGDLLLEAQ